MKQAIGIDYSLTCPAACLYTPEESKFWYAHDTKCIAGLTVYRITPEGEVSERASRLANDLLSWLKYHEVSRVMIEDYAFNATGRVFHIGENTGILKYLLDQHGRHYSVVPPTVVKKFATGKGNADKHKMVAAFLEAYPTARRWIPQIFPRLKDDGNFARSPLSDLADAYWIARYSYENSLDT